MCKWIVIASELGQSNLKAILCHCLSNYQPHPRGNWPLSLEWFLILGHMVTTGSKVWQRVTKACKLMFPNAHYASCQIVWLSSNFWRAHGQEAIGLGFSKVRVAVLACVGLRFNRNAWIVNYSRMFFGAESYRSLWTHTEEIFFLEPAL